MVIYEVLSMVSIEGFEPSPLRPKRSMPPDNTLRRFPDNLQTTMQFQLLNLLFI
jgi:hypothetical protein